MNRLLYMAVALGLAALGHIVWPGYFALLCVWLVVGLIVEMVQW